MNFADTEKGYTIRIIINMKDKVISFLCRQQHTLHETGNYERIITKNDLHFDQGIYPYITMDSTSIIQLNDGSLAFSTLYDAMPTGCHSLSHWIRREQERNYVCYRYSLGTFGKISFMSGAQELNVEKLCDWSPFSSTATVSPVKATSVISRSNFNDDSVWELKPPKDRYKEAKHAAYKSSFPTVFLDGVLLTQGKWYYEVTCKCKNVAVQLGWSDLDSLQSNDGGLGIGDDKHSWAIDGDRRCLWHVAKIMYGKEWKIGDVCGIACSLDVGAKYISFSLNGEWFEPVAFPNIDYSVGLTPGLTVQGVQPGDQKALSYIANFGPNFNFPPSREFRPVSEYICFAHQRYLTPRKDLSVVYGETNIESTSPDDLGPSLDNLPLHSPLMGRQTSAQPPTVPKHKLEWVPVVIRSGHGQVILDTPVFMNGSARIVVSRSEEVKLPCIKNTILTTTGADNMSYPSVVADIVALKSGKWCYEVDICKITSTATCSIGFSEILWNGGDWTSDKGVGSDTESWGVFYKKGLEIFTFMKGEKSENPLIEVSAKNEDCDALTVCIAVDCDEKKMLMSVNSGPIVTAFENVHFSAVTPAISLQCEYYVHH